MKEIIVIGSGIIGLLTAYYLKKAGYAPLIISSELPGIGQSHGNARLLRYYAESEYMLNLTRQSKILFKELEKELGIGILLGQEGLINILKDQEDYDKTRNFYLENNIEFQDIYNIKDSLNYLNTEVNYQYGLLEENSGVLRTEKLLHHLTVSLANNFILDTIESIRIENDKIFLQGITDYYQANEVIFASSYNNHIFLKQLNLESKYSNFTAHIRASFEFNDNNNTNNKPALRDGLFETYGMPIYDSNLYTIGISKTAKIYQEPPYSLYPSNEEINIDKDRLLNYVKSFKNLNPNPVNIRKCWTHTYDNSPDYSEVLEYKNVYFICGYNNWKNAPALANIIVNKIKDKAN